jgi:excisionase family DNA binding protein
MKRKHETDSQQRQTYSIKEASRVLGLSLNATYRAVWNGEIPSIKIGRRYLISVAALDRLLSQPIVKA